MAHDPDDLGRRSRQLGQAPAAHTGVELQVDANALRHELVPDGEVEIGLARLCNLVTGARAHHEDADPRKLAAKRERLRHRRDAQGLRALSQRCARDVARPVAVAVRLDDRPELGPA
jgi:hypothetical protein